MTDRNDGALAPDPDTMSDEDFAAYKTEMAQADGPLPEEEARPEPEKQPEPELQDPEDLSDDELDDAAAKERQESVPHGRFHRERERRKQLETEIGDVRRRYELLEQRTNDILRMQGQPQQPQQREPTFQERFEALKASGDFLGAQELLAERVMQSEQQQAQQHEHSARQRNIEALARRVENDSRADLERAIQSDPTVRDEYLFMREEGLRQLMDVEGLPQGQAMQQLDRYELETFLAVLQRGQRPSDFVRRFANARGFKRKVPDSEVKPDIATQAADIERLNTAKLAAKSLSGGGSEARTTLPSPADLVNMSDEDFAAFKKKYGDNAMAKVMGQ